MLKRYLKIYPHYLAMAIKSKMIYRLDWFLGILGFFVNHGVSLLTLYLALLPVSSVGGWDLNMIMFLYGFLLIPMGVDHTLTDRLWQYGGWLIKDGQMDRVLMKPLNPLFQMCAEFFQEDGLAEIALGVIFMASFGPFVQLTFTVNTVLPIVIGALFTPLIYFSIKLFTMSISFFSGRSISIMSGIYNMNDFGKYPAKIYHNGSVFGEIVYNFFLFILPFGLVGYLPIAAQMNPEGTIPLLWFTIPSNNWLICGLIIVVSLFQLFVSYGFFRFGLRHYSSSGS